MSDNVNVQTSDGELPAASSSLPLTGKSTPIFKIILVFGLLVIICIANVFFFHHSVTNDKKQNKDIETFDASDTNPIQETAQSTTTQATLSPITDKVKEDELQKSIEQQKANDFVQRLQASQNGSSNTGINSSTANSEGSIESNGQSLGSGSVQATVAGQSTDPNTAYYVQASNSTAQHVYASHYGSLPYMIGQGKFIFANLAVAINSDLPGQVSAIVSQDVYGDQGRIILIPKGSLLIGEYKSGLANNQTRIFIVWTRVRTPSGIDIMLGSEGTDALGRAGLTGAIDNHYLARFGSATLIAIIGAGASTVGVNPNDQYNSAAQYRSSVTDALAQQSTNSLNQNANIPPTINVPQGEQIVVFVNRDLDFSRVYR